MPSPTPSCVKVRSAVLILGLALIVAAVVRGAAAPNPATPKVGALGHPAAIEFAGNATFPAESLRRALKGQPEFISVSHPDAPLPDFLAAIESELLRGYRQAGFADATIRVARDPSAPRIIATISEGRRYSWGDIRVEGAGNVPAAAIVSAITQVEQSTTPAVRLQQAVELVLDSQKIDPPAGKQGGQAAVLPFVDPFFKSLAAPGAESLWERGKPAVFGETLPKEVATRVRGLLSQRGYPLAEVAVSVESNANTRLAVLAVRVAEGPRAIIGSLTVTGNARNTRQQILQAAGLREGAAATSAVLAAAQLALWNSARFYAFEVSPHSRGPAVREVDLEIHVEENPALPPLDQALPRADAALVRFANWMTTEAGRREIALQGKMADRQSFRLAISPSEGVAFGVDSSAADGFALAAGKSGGKIVAQRAGRSAGYELAHRPVALSPRFWFVTIPTEPGTDRHSNLSFGTSFETLREGQPLIQASLVVAPSFMLENVRPDTTARFEAGDLILSSVDDGHIVLRCREATGELVAWDILASHSAALKPSAKAAPNPTLVLSQEAGAFRKISAEIDANWSKLPAARTGGALLADTLFAGPWMQVLSELGDQDTLALLGKMAVRLLDTPSVQSWLSAPAESSETAFNIPADLDDSQATAGILAMFGAALFDRADNLWPGGTWPAQLAREILAVLSGDTAHTDAVLQSLHDDPRMGPIGSLVTAKLLLQLSPPNGWRFARRAVDQGTSDGFRNDWRLLLDASSDGSLGTDVLRALATLDPADIAGLPALLGTPGDTIIPRALAALRQQPGLPVTDVLDPYLAEWWDKYMADNREDRVGAFMNSGSPADPAITALLVNGVPASRALVNLARRDPTTLGWVPLAAGTRPRTTTEQAAAALAALMLMEADMRQNSDPQLDEVLTRTVDQNVSEAVKTKFEGSREKFLAELNRQNIAESDFREVVRLRAVFELGTGKLTAGLATPQQKTAAVANYFNNLRRISIVQTLDDPAPTAGNNPAPEGGRRWDFESLTAEESSPVRTLAQPVNVPRAAERWSSGTHVIAAGPSDGWAEWIIEVPADDRYEIRVSGTRASNFGRVQFSVDGGDLGPVQEFYAASLQPTGVRALGTLSLKAGPHRLRATLAGKHPSSQGYQFGLDALDLIPVGKAP